MFHRWFRLDDYNRQKIWRLYGWLTGLMACGSCFGIVAWSTWMLCLVNLYRSKLQGVDDNERMALTARGYSFRPVYTVCYAIAFSCTSMAKLMVFERLWEFAGLRGRWAAMQRAAMLLVVAANCVGLAGNVASAVFFQVAANTFNDAAVSYAANKTADGRRSQDLGFEQAQRAMAVASVQSFCEVTALIVIIIAVSAAAAACVHLIRARLHGATAGSASVRQGRAIMLQIGVTAGLVLVAFVIRSVYAALYAIAYAGQSPACELYQGRGNYDCNAACYNVYSLMLRWIFYSPHLQQAVELASGPVALLVALWGMTSKRSFQIMTTHQTDSDVLMNLR